jgi:mannose-6-phosphate isomerase-like protein (cupin superfamily)
MVSLELSCKILTGALASATVRSVIAKGGEIMAGYVGSIEKQTLANNYFRQVLFTGKYAQLVVMCLQPGEEIGNEVHPKVDQFFRIEQGEATFVFEGKEKHVVKDGDAVIVPAGTYHNVINNSKTAKLKLYTIYSPPNHPDKTVHKTKAEAEKAEAEEHH